MHPSDGTLRRSLDEPVAVDPARREHIARCARCAGRVQRMSADATWVQAVLRALRPCRRCRFGPSPACGDRDRQPLKALRHVGPRAGCALGTRWRAG